MRIGSRVAVPDGTPPANGLLTPDTGGVDKRSGCDATAGPGAAAGDCVVCARTALEVAHIAVSRKRARLTNIPFGPSMGSTKGRCWGERARSRQAERDDTTVRHC